MSGTQVGMALDVACGVARWLHICGFPNIQVVPCGPDVHCVSFNDVRGMWFFLSIQDYWAWRRGECGNCI